MIRLFTAIEIPALIRQRLAQLQSGVPGARWIRQENLHLTLRFIGEVSEPIALDIHDVLSRIQFPSFELSLKGTGEFGKRDARTLWAGASPAEPLLKLTAKIESALQRMGLAAETRKYTPHVTLARLKDAPNAKVREFLSVHGLFDSGAFAVRQFALISSQLSSSGSVYRPEQTYALSGNGM